MIKHKTIEINFLIKSKSNIIDQNAGRIHKVQIFLQGHKIWKQSQTVITESKRCQISSNFCGHLNFMNIFVFSKLYSEKFVLTLRHSPFNLLPYNPWILVKCGFFWKENFNTGATLITNYFICFMSRNWEVLDLEYETTTATTETATAYEENSANDYR